MSEHWTVPAWAAAGVLVATALLVLLGLGLAVAAHRAVRRRRVELDVLRAGVEAAEAARAELEARLARVERAQRPATAGGASTAPHVITHLGEPSAATRDEPVEAVRIEGPLLADLVLRESAVQVGSLAAGLRRALAPEGRARVRAEMRRDLRSSRKQRRADLRAARRDVAARRRTVSP